MADSALIKLPVAFFNMLMALLGFKGADRDFIHTAHSNNEVKNIFHHKGK